MIQIELLHGKPFKLTYRLFFLYEMAESAIFTPVRCEIDSDNLD